MDSCLFWLCGEKQEHPEEKPTTEIDAHYVSLLINSAQFYYSPISFGPFIAWAAQTFSYVTSRSLPKSACLDMDHYG